MICEFLCGSIFRRSTPADASIRKTQRWVCGTKIQHCATPMPIPHATHNRHFPRLILAGPSNPICSVEKGPGVIIDSEIDSSSRRRLPYLFQVPVVLISRQAHRHPLDPHGLRNSFRFFLITLQFFRAQAESHFILPNSISPLNDHTGKSDCIDCRLRRIISKSTWDL